MSAPNAATPEGREMLRVLLDRAPAWRIERDACAGFDSLADHAVNDYPGLHPASVKLAMAVRPALESALARISELESLAAQYLEQRDAALVSRDEARAELAKASLVPIARSEPMYFANSASGFETFDSLAKARDAAAAELSDERAQAQHDGEWSEDVNEVFWGLVFGCLTERRETDDDGKEALDYEMTDLVTITPTDARLIEQAAELDRLRALVPQTREAIAMCERLPGHVVALAELDRLTIEQLDPSGLLALARDQAEWSQRTFGTDAQRGPLGALRHLEKEAREAQAALDDRTEYADCLLLVLDASRRAGMSAVELVREAAAKMLVNKARTWPTPVDDTPVEHVKAVSNGGNLSSLAHQALARDESKAHPEPRGVRFFDAASGRNMILVDEGQPYAGWICYQHPDGQWVTLREATPDDRERLRDARSWVGDAPAVQLPATEAATAGGE